MKRGHRSLHIKRGKSSWRGVRSPHTKHLVFLISFHKANASLFQQRNSRAPPSWSWWRRKAPPWDWPCRAAWIRTASRESLTCGKEALQPGNLILGGVGKGTQVKWTQTLKLPQRRSPINEWQLPCMGGGTPGRGSECGFFCLSPSHPGGHLRSSQALVRF